MAALGAPNTLYRDHRRLCGEGVPTEGHPYNCGAPCELHCITTFGVASLLVNQSRTEAKQDGRLVFAYRLSAIP